MVKDKKTRRTIRRTRSGSHTTAATAKKKNHAGHFGRIVKGSSHIVTSYIQQQQHPKNNTLVILE